jgi:hypothetical protein
MDSSLGIASKIVGIGTPGFIDALSAPVELVIGE